MPKTDACTAAPTLNTTPTSRVQKKELANAETNTDSWHTSCQICTQRETSQFVFENNTIDMNEYIKAINYINSIHGLINETLLSKSGQGIDRNSNLSLKANISMPDLPNFLTLLTSINSLSKNSNASCCQMVSRTTSTSTLSNTCAVADQLTPQENANNFENTLIRKELGNTQDFEDSNQNYLTEANLGRKNEQGDQETQNIVEQLPNSQWHYELESTDFRKMYETDIYYTMKDEAENRECCYKQHSSSAPKQFNNDFTANTKTSHEHDKKQINKQHKPTVQNKVTEQITSVPDGHRKKIGSKTPLGYHVATKGNCNKNNGATVDVENADKPGEPLLSEAELDRFASELLIGVDWESCNNSQISCDSTYIPAMSAPKQTLAQKPKAKSRAPQAPNSEPVKRKPIQKIKEVPPQVKEKPLSVIPVAQNWRPNSSSKTLSNSGTSSQAKNKNCSSSSGSPPLQRSPSSSSKKNSRSDTATVVAGEPPVQVLRFQLSSLTGIDKSKAGPKRTGDNTNRHSSSALLPAQNAATLLEQRRLKQHNSNAPKTVVTYHVQQKEDDDFICPRKTYKTQLFKQSSESIIFSDKDEREITNFTDSDIQNDDLCESKKSKVDTRKSFFFENPASNALQKDLRASTRKISRNGVQSSTRKSSGNNLENMQHSFTSKERLFTAEPVKKKKDSRNKPFRQARRQSGDNEKIMNIRHYISQKKHVTYSDSNSNETGSSDIKSDKDCNAHQVLKTPTTPAFINYFSHSRQHVNHKM